MHKVMRVIGAAGAAAFLVAIIVMAIVVTIAGCAAVPVQRTGCFKAHVEQPQFDAPEVLLERFVLERYTV